MSNDLEILEEFRAIFKRSIGKNVNVLKAGSA